MLKILCVIGGGPIGLYLAIRLAQLGIYVKVIDHRAGVYTRPGQVSVMTFIEISRRINYDLFFNISTDDKDANNHLKELERELYNFAISLKIPIIRKKFHGFKDANNIILIDRDHNLTIESCDFIFDATGSKRVIVNQINHEETLSKFQISSVSYNPLKYFYQTQVVMDEQSVASIKLKRGLFSLFAPELTPLQELNNTLAFYKLSKKYGWPTFTKPELHRFIFNNGKVVIYIEKPENMPEKLNDEWVRDVLAMETGRESFQFEDLPPPRKYEKKPRKCEFEVSPRKTTPFYLTATELHPTIVPIGDALFEPEIRLGQGIIEGIKRVEAFLLSLSIDNREITSIDWDSYNRSITEINYAQTQTIQEKYLERIQEIDCSENYEYDRLNKLVNDERLLYDEKIQAKKIKLLNLYADLKKNPKNFNYHLAEMKLQLSKAIEPRKGCNDKDVSLWMSDLFLKAELLDNALNFHTPGLFKKEIERNLLDLAVEFFKLTAFVLRNKLKNNKVKIFCKMGFKIYDQLFLQMNNSPNLSVSSFFEVSSKNATQIHFLLSLERSINILENVAEYRHKTDSLLYLKVMIMLKAILKENVWDKNRKNIAVYNEIQSICSSLLEGTNLPSHKQDLLAEMIRHFENKIDNCSNNRVDINSSSFIL